MARLPKGQGPGGFSAEQLRKVSKENSIWAANLSDAVRGLGRKALGAMAATALHEVIEYTKHDSSRFAANWDLAFNRANYREAMRPSSYNESPAGGRGDRGANRQAVHSAKQGFYHYLKHPSGAYIPLPGGYIWTKIGLSGQVGTPIGGGRGRPQLGAVARVELFNPLVGMALQRPVGTALQRPDGFLRSYAFNALHGASEGDLTMAEQQVANLVGEGYLPTLVREIAESTRSNKVAGGI